MGMPIQRDNCPRAHIDAKMPIRGRRMMMMMMMAGDDDDDGGG